MLDSTINRKLSICFIPLLTFHAHNYKYNAFVREKHHHSHSLFQCKQWPLHEIIRQDWLCCGLFFSMFPYPLFQMRWSSSSLQWPNFSNFIFSFSLSLFPFGVNSGNTAERIFSHSKIWRVFVVVASVCTHRIVLIIVNKSTTQNELPD